MKPKLAELLELENPWEGCPELEDLYRVYNRALDDAWEALQRTAPVSFNTTGPIPPGPGYLVWIPERVEGLENPVEREINETGAWGFDADAERRYDNLVTSLMVSSALATNNTTCGPFTLRTPNPYWTYRSARQRQGERDWEWYREKMAGLIGRPTPKERQYAAIEGV